MLILLPFVMIAAPICFIFYLAYRENKNNQKKLDELKERVRKIKEQLKESERSMK